MKKIDKKFGEAVRKLRDEKGISQEMLAKALDIPRPSVAQIERGGRDISVGELDIILRIFHITYNDFMGMVKPEKEKRQVKKTDILFDEGKFKQLLLYILQKCGGKPNVGETVLYKLLYFCDFDFFELNEKPLTGMPYRRLQYGPVPDQSTYTPLIQKMIERGEIQKVSRPYVGETVQTKYVAFVAPDTNAFSPEEMKTIDRVINRLSDMSARQIEDHVHNDYPWKAYADGELIDYASVFNRDGEFAQRDYEGEFLQAGANDSFGSLPPLTEEEYEYYINLPEPQDKK